MGSQIFQLYIASYFEGVFQYPKGIWKHANIFKMEINWNELKDAYGSADIIPELLAALPKDPSAVWDDLWSRLCHQGDIYSASLAATPVIINIAIEKNATDFNFYLLPLCIELARQEKKFDAPTELLTRHLEAINKFSDFALNLDRSTLDADTIQSIDALILLSQGKNVEAQAIIDSNSH